MADRSEPPARVRVLLIGVDAYPAMPLYGCVSDIDAIQRLLIDRAGVAPADITRLVSPHPTPARDSIVPARPATRSEIVDAFTSLAGAGIGPTDRVLVYYSGHGTRRPVPPDRTLPASQRTTRFREALVPVDAGTDGTNVIWDFELNALLAAVAARTPCVTVILDCCHSGGAVRGSEACASTARFAPFGDDPAALSEAQLALLASPLGGAGRVDTCQVITACLSHELANEVPRDISEGGTRSGLLTRSLVQVLSELPDDELRTATWGHLWNGLRELVETHPDVPPQHPTISGGVARTWLAGPPDDGEPGIRIRAIDDRPGEFALGAGTLAGVTPGARIAVYGPTPGRFPPLGSDADVVVRLPGALLEVRDATASAATATGEPTPLPPGARGRLVAAGAAERLPCALVPDDPAVAATIAASPLLEITPPDRALVRLEQRAPDGWVLTDDVHGARPGDPVLATLSDQQLAEQARPLLEQYSRYAGALRMARRCTDLPGALRVDLLGCATERVADADVDRLVALTPSVDGTHELPAGSLFCVRVVNTSYDTLRVFVFDAAPGGSVALLGDEVVEGDSVAHLWSGGEHGAPFANATPNGSSACIDRLVAIGTTDLGADLTHLVERGSFDGAATRSAEDAPPAAAVGTWTASAIILRTSTG